MGTGGSCFKRIEVHGPSVPAHRLESHLTAFGLSVHNLENESSGVIQPLQGRPLMSPGCDFLGELISLLVTIPQIHGDSTWFLKFNPIRRRPTLRVTQGVSRSRYTGAQDSACHTYAHGYSYRARDQRGVIGRRACGYVGRARAHLRPAGAAPGVNPTATPAHTPAEATTTPGPQPDSPGSTTSPTSGAPGSPSGDSPPSATETGISVILAARPATCPNRLGTNVLQAMALVKADRWSPRTDCHPPSNI